jgi:hypothetical protein
MHNQGVVLNHKERQKLLRDEFSTLIMKSLSTLCLSTSAPESVLTGIGRRCRILAPRPANVLRGF